VKYLSLSGDQSYRSKIYESTVNMAIPTLHMVSYYVRKVTTISRFSDFIDITDFVGIILDSEQALIPILSH